MENKPSKSFALLLVLSVVAMTISAGVFYLLRKSDSHLWVSGGGPSTHHTSIANAPGDKSLPLSTQPTTTHRSIHPRGSRPFPTPRPSGDGQTIYAFRDGGGLIGEVAAIGPPPYRLRWKYQTDDVQHAGVEGAATITEDTVYVADSRGTLHAIDLASGNGKWKYVSDGGFEATPLVINSRIFIGDLSGVFHCVSTTGEKQWLLDTESGIHGSANADGDKIYFGTDGAQIYCLDQQGKKIFTATAEDRINSAPSIGSLPDGRTAAFFSGCDSKLRAIDLKIEKEVFAIEMAGFAAGSPVLAGDKILIGVDQGHLQCFSIDGKPLWDYTGFRDKATVSCTPAVSISNNIAVVGSQDRQVHAVKLSDGTKIWTFPTRGEVNSSPIISGNRVYTASQDKNVYVLDLMTGKELWKFTTARAVEAAPAVAQGVFVISDTRGNVYCFESEAD